MGRPFLSLPRGARHHLAGMAAHGLLSESAAATALGMPLPELRRVIVDDEASKAIWQESLSIERDSLLAALYSRAMDGDARAAQTLLAVRHGLTERLPQQAAQGGVSIVLQLPAALDPGAWAQAVQAQKALPEPAGQ